MIHDLRASRELTWRLFVRNLSALGYLWALIPPITTTRRLEYLDEQEARYGLVSNIDDPVEALNKAEELLRRPGLKKEFSEKRSRLLADKDDVTQIITRLVELGTFVAMEGLVAATAGPNWPGLGG
jgi:hypothetical protein